ncbi:hypothetical protein B8W95_13805, partial [Staphylococcus pasteuri]
DRDALESGRSVPVRPPPERFVHERTAQVVQGKVFRVEQQGAVRLAEVGDVEKVLQPQFVRLAVVVPLRGDQVLVL